LISYRKKKNSQNISSVPISIHNDKNKYNVNR
jgi:hypothetical protein